MGEPAGTGPVDLEIARREAEALRCLVGLPTLTPAELQLQLDVDADAFMASWDGEKPLPSEARRRLVDLLDAEIARMRAIRRVLAFAPPPGRDPDDLRGRGARRGSGHGDGGIDG